MIAASVMKELSENYTPRFAVKKYICIIFVYCDNVTINCVTLSVVRVKIKTIQVSQYFVSRQMRTPPKVL